MKIESKPLRYAHAEGHTDVCFSEDGQHIITCGHDGDVRIWLGIEDDDPNSHCVGESALAVCFKDKRLYVANDNHTVQAYTFPAFDKDGIVTRFTAPVTQIMSSPQIEVLGCCSENMESKICNLEGGAPLFVMTEHKGPVLSVAICPHMKYAATACGDGVLRIWDIDTQKIVKEVTCVPKINTFYAAKVLCRISFEPTEGKYLAYPNNREIILLDSESWGQRLTFTHNSIKCAISQCLFSPCGQYIAGSTLAGQIAVWEVQSGTCIGIIEHPTSHNVSAMAWSPKGNGVLAYCDIAGQLGMLVNCYGQDSNKVNGDSEDIEMVERDDNDELVENLIHNYESDDDNAISLEKIKNDTLGLTTEQESRPQSRHAASAPSAVPPQPPFQPSATPAHLEHRTPGVAGNVRC
ncbi:WD repeat and HMG-box DNA-binding protein 1 [Papilio xuthus]|uniref:WD repeat and HMG-box DNA-binding protein 1 n=1 Tax=Papilio xuthus TaxID=66420 RepID=A0A0N0P9Z5_PAPXU|nr:WD repeat and HMG-box DNA-binding protein 1 [Papilio xuthus]